MDFSTISRAGLTQKQFGALVGVERVTVNTWVKGKFRPNARLSGRVAAALRLLKQAVKDGHLPIDDSHRERLLEQQLKRISKAIAAEA